MATKLVTSRLIIRNAAQALSDEHPDHVTLCSMAKLYGTETCFEVYLISIRACSFNIENVLS